MGRILIVDDEARFRELYRQVLEEAGFETAMAGSASFSPFAPLPHFSPRENICVLNVKISKPKKPTWGV